MIRIGPPSASSPAAAAQVTAVSTLAARLKFRETVLGSVSLINDAIERGAQERIQAV
jgi:hypothetical protein